MAKKQKPPKFCLTCDKEFVSRRSKSKFCSHSCSMKHPETTKKRLETARKKSPDDPLNHKKRNKTFLKKYGYKSPFALKEVRDKRKQTYIERYGVEHISTLRKANLDKSTLETLYSEGLTTAEIGGVVGVKRTCVENYFRYHNIKTRKETVQSKEERKIVSLLNEHNIEYIQNSRQIIAPKELDIYIPSKKVAIEVNGLYWHSEHFLEKDYHVKKREMCIENDINLLQFYDVQVQDKWPIVSSVILNKLGLTEKIHARKCKIVEMTNDREFLDTNHIQGGVGSFLSYALTYNDEVVSVMSFGKPRFNKKYNWELLRFCNKLGVSVIGGAKKLFSHFLKNHSGSIVSYCNRNLFDGSLYLSLGFEYVGESKPSYFYFNKNKNYIVSRYQAQKHKLPKLLKNFDPQKTEVQNMLDNEYMRIWDSGNGIYVYTK